jgi:hypothetical protein
MNSMSCYSCCRTKHDAKVSGGEEVHQAAVMVMDEAPKFVLEYLSNTYQYL